MKLYGFLPNFYGLPTKKTENKAKNHSVVPHFLDKQKSCQKSFLQITINYSLIYIQ